MSNARASWTSRWGFILAATGAAVGLGNIWKFPYMAGDNGGGAFVMVYLVCVLLIGIPVMAAEILIGRRAQKNSVDALSHLAKESGHSPSWQLLGWWGLAGLLLTLSFYSVVAGWSIDYLAKSLGGDFVGLNAHQVQGQWRHFLASPWQLLLFHSIFMFLTMWVVARGVQKGLEWGSRIMMPLLFLLLFVLVGFSVVTSGPSFMKSVHYLFDFRFNQITGAVVINALGHAFFTLAIGVGAMSVYGSYLPKNVSIGRSIFIIVILDVLVALLAGLAIFPILFKYHLSPSQGPGLMFIALPITFAKMEAGRWIGSFFFALLLFAAWTSSINIAEPLVALLFEKTKLSRVKASVLVGLLAWGLGICSVLAFNVWSHVKIFGHFDVFTFITDTSTNIFLPVGGIFYAIFVGWIMKRKFSRDELSLPHPSVYWIWRILIRYIAPIAIFVVFVTALI